MKPKPIGIHLGDFYSSVGTFEYTGVPEVIANDHGNLSTPSYVAFVGDQQVLIGEAAYDQANMNRRNTVFGVNRFIGRKFEDELVQKQIENVPFWVLNVGGWPIFKVENREYSPKNICSMILGKLKQTAESYLTTTVTEAVITVPDYFNNSQCEVVKDAASTVGLTVLRFIHESAAVTFAYKFKDLEKLTYEMNVDEYKKNVIILELNHEKILNASIVDCGNDFKILASKSANILKGEYKLTDMMVNWLIKNMSLKRTMEIDQTDLEEKLLNFDREYLGQMCKLTKRAFLINSSFNVKFTYISPYNYDLVLPLCFPLKAFKKIVSDTFQSTEQLIRNLLKKAKLNSEDIDAIFLVGHTSRVFKFDKFIKEIFIVCNVEIYDSIPRDKMFAYSATLNAAHMQDEYCKIDRLFRFHCTPLNIGILLKNRIVCPVIERGTIIPTIKSKIFKFPPHSSSYIQIYEGQCLFAQDNNYLNKIKIKYISLRHHGIKITFEIDANGTLIVSTNAYNNPTEITNVKQCRTRAEVELMWEYAELHRVRDDYVRERIGSLTELAIERFDYNRKFTPYGKYLKNNYLNGKYFDWANPEIELPLLESPVPQTLKTNIEKLLQEMSDEFSNLSYFPISEIIDNLNNVSGILNRYSLTKNEFDSIFVNDQQDILEIFEKAILCIREHMLDYFFGFDRKEIKLIFSGFIPENVLLQMRSIQNLLILLVNVLCDQQTLPFGCSYYGVTYKPEAINCEGLEFNIIDSSVASIQQKLETIDQWLQAFNASSANSTNSTQVTNVIYNLKNLKNVLLNTNSESSFGDIAFTNDESVVTKHEDVDVNKLEQTISEMQKIMLKLETIDVIDHSPASEERVPINIDNVLQQMSGIEQLVNTLVSINPFTVPFLQANKKVRSKKIVQNISLESKRLKGRRDVEYKLPSQSSIPSEQNFSNEKGDENICENENENAIEHFEIIECLETKEKSENNSQSTDQQKFTVNLIEQKHPINEKSSNKNTEITKIYNEHDCMVISEESLVQCELKPDAQTESNETNIAQTIETAQTFAAIEQQIETNLSEQLQNDTTDEFVNQEETNSENEQLLQQEPTSGLFKQNKCCNLL